MKAAMPPRRWASEITCRARVVLPEDSGPKISTTRPRGMPPTPRAASRESDPVGMAGTSTFSRLPRRMIDPLPNCLSICARAASIALARSFRSSAIGRSPPYQGGWYRRGGTAEVRPERKNRRRYALPMGVPGLVLLATTLAVPFVPQQKDTCGPAALAMVLRYWGLPVSHDVVARELKAPDLRGVAGSRLEEFARDHGLLAVAHE